MAESRDKFSVWSSTEFLESDYDFLSLEKKPKQKKKTKRGGGGGGGKAYIWKGPIIGCISLY